MTEFTLTEDFPNSEIEFDQRLSNIDACYEYLAQSKWPNGFTCEKCRYSAYWISSETSTFGTKFMRIVQQVI